MKNQNNMNPENHLADHSNELSQNENLLNQEHHHILECDDETIKKIEDEDLKSKNLKGCFEVDDSFDEFDEFYERRRRYHKKVDYENYYDDDDDEFEGYQHMDFTVWDAFDADPEEFGFDEDALLEYFGRG